MIRFIINADDCGRTKYVDERIELFIKNGKISSTTVMANMEDLDGARKLYDTYKNEVSFGVHLNLTEGQPMLYSQPMLDAGLYIEKDGKVEFNTQWARNKVMSKVVRNEIMKEFDAQIMAIKDNGIKISHLDSHHHIHTTLLCLMVTPVIASRHGITKMRRLCNYRPFGVSYLGRQAWAMLVKMQNPKLKLPDYFADYGCIYSDVKNGICKDGVIEIMCHPGGMYVDEEEMMLRENIVGLSNAQMINYNQL